jgi:coproporphyrinogen III oxidase-like Fe-S oxidoreductase
VSSRLPIVVAEGGDSTEGVFEGYTYAYPHKTAYRTLDPPVRLADAWASEDRQALFLYLHIPFCEMRCGYCNLFTRARPAADEIAAFLAALARQARRVRAALGEARFARLAIGGGTPTMLGPRALEGVLDLAGATMGAEVGTVPASIEASPATADQEILTLLVERGIQRLSLGVESFHDRELAALGRPERVQRAEAALERIRAAGVPTLNIDLIYGITGQTVPSWLASLERALRFEPEEIYLYPLYVRPLTGLARRSRPVVDERLRLYREGRDYLRAAGYQQRSMRMFRRASATVAPGPVYCCQEDATVGLGAGARSYTRALHYADHYGVGAAAVREILDDYARRPDERFDLATWGVRLDRHEQRRRYVIKSLLRTEGLAEDQYQAHFGTAVFDDLPELARMVAEGLFESTGVRLVPTALGLERSDSIGPRLVSAGVASRMRAAELR